MGTSCSSCSGLKSEKSVLSFKYDLPTIDINNNNQIVSFYYLSHFNINILVTQDISIDYSYFPLQNKHRHVVNFFEKSSKNS